MKKNNSAFSLLEMGIALALAALLMGLVIAQFSFLNRFIVRSDIALLRSACNYLQCCARATNQPQYLKFDLHNHSYSFNNFCQQFSRHVRFGILPGIKGPPGKAVNDIKNPISFKKNQIVFYPDGIISSGTVYLVDCDKQLLYALSSSVGHIACLRTYCYQGHWKLLS